MYERASRHYRNSRGKCLGEDLNRKAAYMIILKDITKSKSIRQDDYYKDQSHLTFEQRAKNKL